MIVLWLLASTLNGPTFASGYAVQQQSAQAAGLGYAATALSDSPAAAFYNPALLTDDEGLRMSLGFSLAASTITAQSLDASPDAPWTAKTRSGVSTPPHLYASYAKNNWAVGVTTNAAHASRIRWANDWPYRFDIIESKPQFFRFTGFVAYRFGTFSVAIGPQIDAGSLFISKATNHITEEGSATLALRGVGWGLHGSLAWNPTPNWTVGLRYWSRSGLKLSGEADFDMPPAFAHGYPDQQVSTDWKLPDHLSIGARWRLKTLAIHADVSLSLWSVQQDVVFEFEQSEPEPLRVEYNWRNSTALRLGAEWSVHKVVQLRAGTYLDGMPAPGPALTLSPASPDNTRFGLTVGAGWKAHKSLRVHGFYEWMTILPRDSESLDAPMARYSGTAHIGGLSIQGHFGARAAPDATESSTP